jgi:hypothetical protein
MFHLSINDDKIVSEICHKTFPDYRGRKVQIDYNCKQITTVSYTQH